MTLAAVECPIRGTWLIHPIPLPIGQTPASGVAVHQYTWGYSCEACGPQLRRDLECTHIHAVREVTK